MTSHGPPTCGFDATHEVGRVELHTAGLWVRAQGLGRRQVHAYLAYKTGH